MTQVVLYYDQTKDLYYLRALYNYEGLRINKNIIDDMTKGCPKNENPCSLAEEVGCKSINNLSEVDETNLYLLNSSEDNFSYIKFYITDYVAEPTSSDDEFNKYLHQLKKTSWDKDSYRLIGVFQEGTNPKRYASIKIYNPNDKGFCEGKY